MSDIARLTDEQLREVVRRYRNVIHALSDWRDDLEQQNAQLREALQQVAWMADAEQPLSVDAGRIAREALEKVESGETIEATKPPDLEAFGDYLVVPSIDRQVWCVVGPSGHGEVYWSPHRQQCIDWIKQREESA